ncbi:MAG: 23S rRNA (adenine(2503)-C(2))-methyltransferase RlmN [Marinifilaceae bacterium]|jgi:23S rRNA (adenine2503-C2)-methyltransferase|nr:23S rRNA (adenine(2503)-C(2))-methyltransferase RlmN [Marinifilaceae bacterium]
MKINLLGKSLKEIEKVVLDLGMKKFLAKQITDWIYNKKVDNFDHMRNISIKNRELLSNSCQIGHVKPINVQESVDGTKKYLFNAPDNKFIETAYIPDKDRHTVCVSSQVGCKMGCKFCFTAKQGFQSNLSATDIINQLVAIDEADKITNIVYMGMGEPFDNIDEVLKSTEILCSNYGMAMSPRRITVSTIGHIPGLKRFLNESDCHLAVSLHSPFDEERSNIMPVQKAYPIKDVLNEIRNFDFDNQRRVSFEYIMFKDVNDSQKHVSELVKILRGIKCRINLIKFHPIPDSDLEGSDDFTIERFKNALNKKGIVTTTRKSRGQDIYAACGLLSTKKQNNQE